MPGLLPIAMFTLQYFVGSSQNDGYGKRGQCLLGEVRLGRKMDDLPSTFSLSLFSCTTKQKHQGRQELRQRG